MDKVRVDKYLWAIRIFKTRSAAAEACEKGWVKRNGEPVKASKPALVGEEYEIKTESRKWIIRTKALIENRVAYAEAIKCYDDLTPEEWLLVQKTISSSFYTGKRLSKVGRPTKQQRRDLDKFMQNDTE